MLVGYQQTIKLKKSDYCFFPDLLDAVEKENLAETRRLLRIDVESVNVKYGDGSNDTLLHKAARKGYCKIVNELLIYHANVNAQNKEGCTALILASLNGHYEIVIELTKFNADVNAQKESGGTALMGASLQGHQRIVKELLNYHADVNLQDSAGSTALIGASCNGHYEIVKELLNYHADVNVQSRPGITALIAASCMEHLEIVRLLLNHHADANIQTNDGNTALMSVLKRKNYLIVMELCNHNADVNLQDSDGNTALHSVLLEKVTDNTINIVKLLLSDNANLEKVNKENKSVIQLAQESHNQDIVQLIKDFSERKKIEAAKREFKKLQANQIINEKKKKLQEVRALNEEVLDLNQNINQLLTKNTELEEEIKKNCEKIKIWQCALKSKTENQNFDSYEKLKEDIEYFDRCIETEMFDNVICLAERECPICFNEMKSNRKLYQCQAGHIFCIECFGRINEGAKICSFCKINIASNPIQSNVLEEMIDEEAGKYYFCVLL